MSNSRFVIQSDFIDPEDNCALYWNNNNEYGWGAFETATIFTEKERNSRNLPIGALGWVELKNEDKPVWTRKEWGRPGTHRWIITDGTLDFEIHQLIDGSHRTEKYPDGYIVTPEQADEYAEKIVSALNKGWE